jgi:hypothetical protein
MWGCWCDEWGFCGLLLPSLVLQRYSCKRGREGGYPVRPFRKHSLLQRCGAVVVYVLKHVLQVRVVLQGSIHGRVGSGPLLSGLAG